MFQRFCISILTALSLCNSAVYAHYESEQEKQISKKKVHDQTFSQVDPWKLFELAISPAYASSDVSIVIEGVYRIIKSDGLPNHITGEFPNAGNPNTISEQNYTFRVSTKPQLTGVMTPLGQYPFGVAVNGIPFDPGTAEWWNNDPLSGWHYEAMPLGPRLGLDQNNAHVQPNGAYHYHGIPTGLLDKLATAPKPVLLGYAADGFPIYAPYSYTDPMDPHSGMKQLNSSYRVKGGSRSDGPGGEYDGTFTEDYEYVRGRGDLDDSNGRFGITTEFPKGTYYYVITQTFPFIPRSFKGTPDSSFRRRGGPSRTGYGGRQGYGPPGGRQGYGPPGGRQGYGPPGGRQGYEPPDGGQGYGLPGGGQGYGPPGGRQGYGPPGGGQGYGPPGGGQGHGPPGGGQGYGLPDNDQ